MLWIRRGSGSDRLGVSRSPRYDVSAPKGDPNSPQAMTIFHGGRGSRQDLLYGHSSLVAKGIIATLNLLTRLSRLVLSMTYDGWLHFTSAIFSSSKILVQPAPRDPHHAAQVADGVLAAVVEPE